MAVPDFQSWLLPLLRRLSDGGIHRMADLYEQLANELRLSEADKQERLPSGAQQTYMNRIAWARTYLKKAGLLASSTLKCNAFEGLIEHGLGRAES